MSFSSKLNCLPEPMQCHFQIKTRYDKADEKFYTDLLIIKVFNIAVFCNLVVRSI